MMTSSNGNIFRDNGPSCEEFTGHHKGQWRGALLFSLIHAWVNGWVNHREAGDSRRHRAHCDVIIMVTSKWINHCWQPDKELGYVRITHWDWIWKWRLTGVIYEKGIVQVCWGRKFTQLYNDFCANIYQKNTPKVRNYLIYPNEFFWREYDMFSICAMIAVPTAEIGISMYLLKSFKYV